MGRASWFGIGVVVGIVLGAALALGVLLWAGLLVLRSTGGSFHRLTPALTGQQSERLSRAFNSKSPPPSGALLVPEKVGPFRPADSPPPKLPVPVEIDDAVAVYETKKGRVCFYHETTDDWPSGDPCDILAQRVPFEDRRHHDYWQSDLYTFTRIELKSTDDVIWAWTNGDNIFVVTSPDDALAETFITEYPY